ncbi:MAG TPA: alanine--glyoxylate aminotransferase family protein [Nitrososphaeraceae archaeon]|nr:alanine--glyoxylate aminotransferase family protein [Nitrososphaeraceae archaeon]
MEYLVMLPGPTNVPDRVMNAMLSPIINHRSDDFRTLYRDVVDKTQRVFQTSNDVIVLTASGTGAVEASVINIVKKNDKIIIPVNGEFGGRLADLIENWGGSSIRINAKFGENPPLSQIEDAFETNKDTKALYAVYNETSTGTTLRYLEKLGEICSRYGSLFIVDAVSILGGDELPVDRWGIDVCVTATQKALAAPPGLAPISISPRAKKQMLESPPPTQYFNLKRYFKYFVESGETPFTPALPLLSAYQEALRIVLEEGLERRVERHKRCANAFYTGLSELGFTPFAHPEARSNVVIAFNYMPGIEDKTFRKMLGEHFRVLVAGGFGELKGKVFRIGSMGEVDRYHVVRTLSSIALTLKMMGVQTESEAIPIALKVLNV